MHQADKLKAALMQYKLSEPSDKQVESTAAVHRTPDVNKDDNVSKTSGGVSSNKSVRQSSAKSTPQLTVAHTPDSNEVSMCIFLWLYLIMLVFLQRVSIACYAECCISHDRFCLTVRPSVTRWYHVKTTPATIMRSSLEDSPMILVSSWLTSPRNSKGNIGSEGAE